MECLIVDEDAPPIVHKCVDCKKPITYGKYIRCFFCNRDKWINETNEKEIIDMNKIHKK